MPLVGCVPEMQLVDFIFHVFTSIEIGLPGSCFGNITEPVSKMLQNWGGKGGNTLSTSVHFKLLLSDALIRLVICYFMLVFLDSDSYLFPAC